MTALTEFREIRRAADERLAADRTPRQVRIQIGSATCENAAGATEVLDEFRKHIRATGRDDIVIHQTGCTGRCSCEPIVNIAIAGHMPVKYENVDRNKAHQIFTEHVIGGQPLRDYVLDAVPGTREYEFYFCEAHRCGAALPRSFRDLFVARLAAAGIPETQVAVMSANCFGLCHPGGEGRTTHLLVRPSNVVYSVTNEEDLDEIIAEHIRQHRVVERLLKREEFLNRGFFSLYGDVSFFNRQTRIALRNSGVIDPESIDEAIAHRGFQALATVLERGDPAWVRDMISRSRLRGRGGGGYSTGLKWDQAAAQNSQQKYMICNADEGDPGAFMDRSMLEGDPYSIIEGLIIAGFAIGAAQGYFYVRAEYPLAVRRIENALTQARALGLLGRNILGSGFDFDLDIRLGAGAFVCGEETALIHSIEGQRGQPRVRPPYPTSAGLWGQPTCINNVETLANVPVIILYGPDWFQQIGTPNSGGTKVFALAGKVQQTGLVEIPMGATLHEIVYDIGGGVRGGKQLKAVQTGGPAGGCIRADLLDTRVDFDTLAEVGSIMGSGGMIVLDEDDCVVDLAKFFMRFSENESCGKCTPCREGTKRMLEILDRITSGFGSPDDLRKLERLGRLMQKSSLCGLGRAAANPVLSTLHYFTDEYAAHVAPEKSCPAHRCRALILYQINDKCVGCTLCARRCPVGCIDGQRREHHVIDQSRCIKCGLCYEVCRFDAVSRQ